VKTSATETSYTAEIQSWRPINKSRELPLQYSVRFRMDYMKKNEKNYGVVADS
jgi:hypothetical protein